MRTKININLFSQQSIVDAIRSVEAYKLSVENNTKRFVQELGNRGVEIAYSQIVDLDALFTTELLHSLKGEFHGLTDGGVFFVKVGTNHCAFVEFGTGYYGEHNSYPCDFPQGVDWEYGSGKTIRQLEDGTYGWFYPVGDGTYKFTRGMPARPYMHNTLVELCRIAREVAKVVFGNGN